MILGVIFSKDRAMQLDATLRSFYLHCADANEAQMHVVYKTSSDLHARQYASLEQIYPEVHFHPEGVLRNDLLGLMKEAAQPAWMMALSHRVREARRRRLWLQLWSGFLEFPRYVLFLVDDNLFVRDFTLKDITHALASHVNALGFSLRLGKNINYSYPWDKSATQPEFKPARQNISVFRWMDAVDEFNYPLELSSSIYRLDEMLTLLEKLKFENPNRLEAQMAKSTGRFEKNLPDLLCYNISVTFCNPVNRVQDVYKNRAGQIEGFSSEELASLFEKGRRVQVESYSGFMNNACHQEVELHFDG
jgi:hypothetical protein